MPLLMLSLAHDRCRCLASLFSSSSPPHFSPPSLGSLPSARPKINFLIPAMFIVIYPHYLLSYDVRSPNPQPSTLLPSFPLFPAFPLSRPLFSHAPALPRTLPSLPSLRSRPRPPTTRSFTSTKYRIPIPSLLRFTSYLLHTVPFTPPPRPRPRPARSALERIYIYISLSVSVSESVSVSVRSSIAFVLVHDPCFTWVPVFTIYAEVLRELKK
ncbi:hypothetical protein GYMLUDRAFT_251418 [Collybiopsis luxurians FD-317 M1]|uniref:Uncharacterized protein n=1 Tax=Collybiopsis luxurians FD-317 M1 TaxID=944289 RepID=A0A0D0CBC6_9AGAR|nr:hypothetical protein GYMLUDRAFT_251418 [Collybiopsis luxurians FD-317 M1]